MEMYAILFSCPAAFVATLVYAVLLRCAASLWPGIRPWFRGASLVVLGGLGIEVLLWSQIGAVSSRRLLGPSFELGHLVFFFFSIPAIANLMVLQRRVPFLANPFVASAACAIFAPFLATFHYDVMEALFGINGTDGPFSLLFPATVSQLV